MATMTTHYVVCCRALSLYRSAALSLEDCYTHLVVLGFSSKGRGESGPDSKRDNHNY